HQRIPKIWHWTLKPAGRSSGEPARSFRSRSGSGNQHGDDMRKKLLKSLAAMAAFTLGFSCNPGQPGHDHPQTQTAKEVTAKDLLGKPGYLAISYGGYRGGSRDVQPTVSELKEDMRILAAMNVRVLRTYNTK